MMLFLPSWPVIGMHKTPDHHLLSCLPYWKFYSLSKIYEEK